MDVQELYQVLGMLWCNGCKVDWYVHSGKGEHVFHYLDMYLIKLFDSDVVLSDIFNRSNDEDVKSKYRQTNNFF